MQSLYIILWINNKMIVNRKKLTLKMAEIINNKCNPSHISNFKKIWSIYCWSAPQTHHKPTKVYFEQFSGKKEQSIGFLDLTWTYEGLEISLIWSLYWKSVTVSTQNIIDRPQSNLEEEKLIVIVIIKASSLGTFIMKIISKDFWTYCSSALKSWSALEATISFKRLLYYMKI